MSHAPSSIGPYEVIAKLGEGGMGEVYRARDTKLGREVALKILPDAFARDAERLARFEREARTLAALNHPHIAQIHGFEQSESASALVMELVEGEDLAQRLARGPIAIDEALPIARQIAEALEAAHEQGIIHRDLKPANIKVRPDGTVKVLDFGLAKALDGGGRAGGPGGPGGAGEGVLNSPTITSPAMTMHGMILGTAAYMSPEQAKGSVVDRRADIWAFGCVLYEMLTGTRAFPGGDVTETLAAVIKSDPDWAALPAATPMSVRRLLSRALQKDRRQRLADIRDARLELDDVHDAPLPAPSLPRARREYAAWGLAAVATVAAIALFVTNARVQPDEGRVVRSIIIPPSELEGAPALRLAASPDGRAIAFPARDANGTLLLWVRPLDALEARPLAGTEGASGPFWSPDSQHLAFTAAGKLRRVPAAGGPVTTLADAHQTPPGAWSKDGVIVFSPAVNTPLSKVPAAGGTATAATRLAQGDVMHSFPAFLSDGRRFLYAATRRQNTVIVGSLDSLEERAIDLGPGALPANVQYVAGHLAFTREGTVVVQRLDETTLTLVGDAVAVAQNVLTATITGGTVAFAISAGGVLAYQTRGDGIVQPAWFDGNGRPLAQLGHGGVYGGLTLSPDAGTAAVAYENAGQRGLMLLDTARGFGRRLPDTSQLATFSADGKVLFFRRRSKEGSAIFSKPTGGDGADRLLLDDGRNNMPLSASRDGQYLLYSVGISATRAHLWVLPLAGGQPAPYLESLVLPTVGEFSPDSRFVVYVSNESGQNEVWAASFPKPEGRWQVSTGGGSQPRWGPGGKSIIYVSGAKLVSTDVDINRAALQTGATRALFDMRDNSVYMFDVAPDGRILALIDKSRGITPVHLVTGWPALLPHAR